MTITTTSDTASHAFISSTVPSSSKTRECMIMLGLACYTFPRPESFTLLPTGQYAWLAVLFDGVGADAEPDTSFVAFLSAKDDSVFERNLLVSRLQNLAYEYGYRQCEVRSSFHEPVDSYETIFSGPIRGNNRAIL